MEYNNVYSLTWTTGITLFWKKKAPTLTNSSVTIKGRMICINDTPADFMASNSRRSPKFPKVINEANRIAKGSAIGTRNKAAYINISANTGIPRPFPTISSMYRQRNCINTINRQIPNVIRNNGRNVCSINVYNRFILNIA